MKYYKELAELGCFSQKELVQLLGSGSAAASCGGVFEKRICGTHPPRPVCHRQHGDRAADPHAVSDRVKAGGGRLHLPSQRL